MKEKKTFAEKHPKINFLIGLLLLIGMVIAAVLLVKWVFGVVGSWIVSVVNFVENFVNTSDQVIVVAMITGAVSITGVVISSIVAKIVEYKMVSEFSIGLTLWGSNRVVKKWLKYRKSSIKGDKNILWEMEDIIYEIRKDVGLGRRLKKGDMLSFFVNDIENLK